MPHSLDATELYLELLKASPEEQKRRLAEIAQLDPMIADDLANMLEVDVEEDEVELGCYVSFATADESIIGSEVMGFKIVDLISDSGGMGRIYRGEQVVSNSDGERRSHYAAIKVLRSEVISAKQMEKYFFREASSLIELDHPNICRVFGVAEVSGLACIVMEYIDGVTLDEWCQQGQDVTERTSVVGQILQAMRYAHSRHIFHGDLKPQNILITPDNSVRIIDLGLAKRIEESQLQSGEQSYIRGYSKQWSSPEQIEGRWSYSQSDVFSLGRIVDAIYDANNPSCRLPRKQQNKELAAILTKATQHDPLKRYYSAADLLVDFQRLHEGFPVTPYRNDAIYRFSKYCQRHPWRIGTYAVAIASLCVVATLIVRNNIMLQKKQRSSEQIIAQMEKTLSNNLPSLSYYYQSQTVDEMYKSAAKEWLKGTQELEVDARYSTGMSLVSGLFDTQQLDIADKVLQAVGYEQLSKRQRIEVDKWQFKIAGAQHLKTNYMLGGSAVTEQLWYKNPELIEPVSFDQEKLDYYLNGIDEETLTRDEWLTAFFALGVIRPFDKQQQLERLKWVRQKVEQFVDTRQWNAQSLEQKIDYLSVFAIQQTNGPILTGIGSPLLDEDRSESVRQQIFAMAKQSQQLSLSQKQQVAYIVSGVAKTSEENQISIDMSMAVIQDSGLKPTEYLLMTQSALNQFTTNDYQTSREELTAYTQNILENYQYASAGLLSAINMQSENALKLGLQEQARKILTLKNDPAITQKADYNQSGTLTAEFMLAVLDRDIEQIDYTTKAIMQFKGIQAENLLKFVGKFGPGEDDYYYRTSYHVFYSMANENWPAVDKSTGVNLDQNDPSNLLAAYASIVAGNSGRALERVGDVNRLWVRLGEFNDLPMPLVKDAVSEIYFLYGRKSDPKVGFEGLRTQANMYHFKQQKDNVLAAKNMLFQFGLSLRNNPTKQQIQEYQQWLDSSPALKQLPQKYQRYYAHLIEMINTHS